MSYIDYSGWMLTTEETTPDPETEKKGLRKLLSLVKDTEEAYYLVCVLGLTDYLEDLREDIKQELSD